MKRRFLWILPLCLPLLACQELAQLRAMREQEEANAYWQAQGRYRQGAPPGTQAPYPYGVPPAGAQAPSPYGAAQPNPALSGAQQTPYGQPGVPGAMVDPYAARGQGYPPQANATPQAGADWMQPQKPLMGWDGGIVDGQPQGSVADGETGHGLEPSVEGRMHIIELYQQVLDERDALLDEVEALQLALSRAHGTIDQGETGSQALQQELAQFQSTNTSLRKENEDMAARLTTAQIRRLEAEKLLLETRISMHRESGGPAGRPVGSTGGQ